MTSRFPRGRGSLSNPGIRFESTYVHLDPAERDEEGPPTTLLRDRSRSIISRNSSPDLGFEASLNPYRGCEHGCAYCYARPTHEYLGFSAGLDFETKILVKEDAPALLRDALSSPRWKPTPLAMSGVTDPYQPIERRLGITRGCLEVLAEARHPVIVVTKNHLVTRDIDLLSRLAAVGAVAVMVSVTSLDRTLQRRLEPRTSTPERRLDAIAALAEADIPVGVMVAPVIPGLNEQEVPAILEHAAGAGARFASYTLLRLPHGVKDLFSEWLAVHEPGKRNRVLNRIRSTRSGKLYDASFETRGRGTGPWADQILRLFRVTRARHGLGTRPATLNLDAFRRPAGAQGELFDSV